MLIYQFFGNTISVVSLVLFIIFFGSIDLILVFCGEEINTRTRRVHYGLFSHEKGNAKELHFEK